MFTGTKKSGCEIEACKQRAGDRERIYRLLFERCHHLAVVNSRWLVAYRESPGTVLMGGL